MPNKRRRTTAYKQDHNCHIFSMFQRPSMFAAVRRCVGYPPLTAKTGVRVPLGAPIKSNTCSQFGTFVWRGTETRRKRRSSIRRPNGVLWRLVSEALPPTRFDPALVCAASCTRLRQKAIRRSGMLTALGGELRATSSRARRDRTLYCRSRLPLPTPGVCHGRVLGVPSRLSITRNN